jgi:hypothetical protein
MDLALMQGESIVRKEKRKEYAVCIISWYDVIGLAPSDVSGIGENHSSAVH